MLRCYSPAFMSLGLALGLLFVAGCQSDESEPIAEAKKYEVDDEPTTPVQPAVPSRGDLPQPPSAPPSEPDDPASGQPALTESLPVAPAPAVDPRPKGEIDPQPLPTTDDAGTPPPAPPEDSGKGDQGTPGKPAGDQRPRAVGGNPQPGVSATGGGGSAPINWEAYNPDKNATPKELVAHLAKLGRVEPQTNSLEAQRIEAEAVLRGRIRASEMLMNTADSSVEQKLLGVNVKIDSLNRLNQLGQPDLLGHVKHFVTALKDHPIPQLASKGRLLYLAVSAGELAHTDDADPKWVADEVIAVLKEEPKSAELFQITQETSIQLFRLGFDEAGHRCADAVVKCFENDKDPDIVKSVKSFQEGIALAEFKIGEKIEAAMTGKTGAAGDVVKAAQAAAKLENRGLPTLQLLAESAQYMEFGGHYREAGQINDTIEVAFSTSKELRIQEYVKQAVSSARKRLALIGKPLPISGEKVGGGELQWSDYEGKVVLVDFWATWCQPCLQEMPNIAANYAKYKNKGFEVIGYNLDEDPKALAAFFESQELPWPSVLGKDSAKRGFGADEFANSLGIDGIPFVVLIGRDGNVVAIHVRGPMLGERLEQLLGDKKAAEPAEKKPAK